MTMLNQDNTVEDYLEHGCGRCSDFQTPNCKVHRWPKELQALRTIVLASGLNENIKWGVPCYSDRGKNILMVTCFRPHAALSFFQGALLTDPKGLLQKPGENSRFSRVLYFTDAEQIEAIKVQIECWIQEAVQNARSGKTIEVSKDIVFTAEMNTVFSSDPELQTAFEALTPGRQRGYILYFSQPKKEETRFNRIAKYRGKILQGKGWNDR